jgi:hypothetical protein
MYACVPETGRGFFEGVCALATLALESSGPPPPLCAWIMDMNFGQAFEKLSARH